MTDTLTKVVVDCSTGEQTILPLTADEIASLELSRQEAEARKAEEDAADAAKAAAKQSAQEKLKSLGLSDIEIAAITNI
jgi:hypothetical protein